MSTHTRTTAGESGELEKIRRIYRSGSDEEFARRICDEIVDMIMKGRKVYLTERSARILGPVLEKYGIILVPAERIEYPCVVIDASEEERLSITFFEHRENALERKVGIELFVRTLEEILEALIGRRRRWWKRIALLQNWVKQNATQ